MIPLGKRVALLGPPGPMIAAGWLQLLFQLSKSPGGVRPMLAKALRLLRAFVYVLRLRAARLIAPGPLPATDSGASDACALSRPVTAACGPAGGNEATSGALKPLGMPPPPPPLPASPPTTSHVAGPRQRPSPAIVFLGPAVAAAASDDIAVQPIAPTRSAHGLPPPPPPPPPPPFLTARQPLAPPRCPFTKVPAARRPLRSLHWDTLEQTKGTIWEAIDYDMEITGLDYARLDTAFAAKPAGRPPAAPAAGAALVVLSSKDARNLEIVLKKHPRAVGTPIDQLPEALVHALGITARTYIDEELGRLQAAPKELLPVERFLRDVTLAAGWRAALGARAHAIKGAAAADLLQGQLADLAAAAGSVVASKALPVVLARLLFVGAYINQGTGRAAARGIQHTSLPALALLLRHMPHCPADIDLAALARARKISLKALHAMHQDLPRGHDRLQQQYEATLAQLTALCTYFGVREYSPDEAELLMGSLHDFLRKCLLDA